MAMKLDTKTILLILAAVVVAGGAYWYFFTGTGGDALPLTALPTGGNQVQVQFDTLVGELTPISFTSTIFSDPRFASLVDLATPITPEGAGRIDPFAPIPGVKTQ